MARSVLWWPGVCCDGQECAVVVSVENKRYCIANCDVIFVNCDTKPLLCSGVCDAIMYN